MEQILEIMVREHAGPRGSSLRKFPDLISYQGRYSAETYYAGCLHMAPVPTDWYYYGGGGSLNFVKTAVSPSTLPHADLVAP